MIKVGIVGYGNLGRGVELAIDQNPDMELIAIFTRRPVESIQNQNQKAVVLNINRAEEFIDRIDVMILCGGSSTDIPIQGPHFARMFNTVDAYDNHKNMPQYIESMNAVSIPSGKTNAVGIGWDPGLFSMNRVLFETVLPHGSNYTFWGPGVSQGHSDALRKIKGVKDAVQYTIPNEKAINRIRDGKTPEFTEREKHKRECYVVAEESADKDKIVDIIISMPNYFKDYDTSVRFISEKELKEKHSGMFHGGFVIRSGKSQEYSSNNHIMEFSLNLHSNSEFTASVLVAYARAAYRLNREGCIGAKTVFDIPLKYLSPRPLGDLYKTFL